MRRVPYRHDEATLSPAEPLHHRLAAWRPAHTLGPPVERLERDQHSERRVDRLDESGREHDGAGEQQSKRQEVLRVVPIGYRTHQELRDAVGD